jgi:CDP-diacylglycerol---glycerol-3-phosphate 3-phosphatidyltransferase
VRSMGWANRLTLLRGVLALVLWAILGLIGHGRVQVERLWWWLAFAVFLAAAATDGLDGWIARRLGEVSVFGRIADPLVDKILILGSLLFLIGVPDVAPDVLPPWTAAVILFRELIVTGLRSEVETLGGNFQAALAGKAKMVLQCVAVGSVLLHQADFWFLRAPFPSFSGQASPGAIGWPYVFCVIAALMSAYSGIDYVRRAVRALRTNARA